MTYEPPRRSDGSIELQRIKLPWPKDRPFRILAIDGGGICGILPAAYLRELEGRFLNGGPIGSYFDMIAGTSTGGVIALGLACAIKADEILKLYTERGETIFPPGNFATRALRKCRHVVRYIYDENSLETELRKIFRDRVLGEATTRLVIPAFEGRYGEPWIYKTPHHPDYSKDQHEQMARVAMATAAAPTYFKAFEKIWSRTTATHFSSVTGLKSKSPIFTPRRRPIKTGANFLTLWRTSAARSISRKTRSEDMFSRRAYWSAMSTYCSTRKSSGFKTSGSALPLSRKSRIAAIGDLT